MSSPVELLDQPEHILLALSPIRRQLLARLREPTSATQLASKIGMSRQRVNYHLRALEQAGLIQLVEERQRRGCTERILVASADAFVVDPAVMDAGGPARVAVEDKFAAEHLVGAAADIVRNVARMQGNAERDGTRLLTFTIETEVRFAAPDDVERFTTALAEAVGHIATDFTSPAEGRSYRVVVGGYPTPKLRSSRT